MVKDIADVVRLLADLSEGADTECHLTIFHDLSWRINRNADAEQLADGDNIFIDIRDAVSRARLFETIMDRNASKPIVQE